MVLTNMFKEVIIPAFHSSSRSISTKEFGTTPLTHIPDNLQRLYGKPGYQELDALLLYLGDSMNTTQPLELMLRGIEEVQLFLLANPGADCAFESV